MSILARNVRAPSGNSPAFMRASRSRFSVHRAVVIGSILSESPVFVGLPPASCRRRRLCHLRTSCCSEFVDLIEVI